MVEILEKTEEKRIAENGFNNSDIKGLSRPITCQNDTEAAIKSSQQTVHIADTDFPQRETWARKTEYILTMMGYCVGLGNVCRFPYVCVRNGGGAFLVPYCICIAVCGIPLYFLEAALGQFVSGSVMRTWNVCPLFKGIGLSMNTISIIFHWYYIMYLAWSLIYLTHSVRSPLPWTLCDQSWNTDRCVHKSGQGLASNVSTADMNNTAYTTEDSDGRLWNGSVFIERRIGVSASEEFWLNNVLEVSSGLDSLGGVPWHNAVALLAAYVICMACLIRGVRSVGKVVYISATLPYILLLVLIIRGVTLPGAIDGVLFYVWPDFRKLLQLQTWLEASMQAFYSVGVVGGGIITASSYNKFRNNCLKDSVILVLVCEGTSVYAGFAIVSVLGHMSHVLNVPIANFSASGPGLAFVVYPEALSYLPVPQLWGVLFFVMLFMVGLDSQFTGMEICLSSLYDVLPRNARKWRTTITAAFGVFLFFMAIPLASRGGMFIFQLFDWYIGAFSCFLIGILECVVIAWIYGLDNISLDIEMMIGRRPPFLFAVLWKYITPTVLACVMVTSLLAYEPPVFEDYTYGPVAVMMGWTIASLPILPVLLHATIYLVRLQGNFKKRLKIACTPTSEWCPSDINLREQYALRGTDSKPHPSTLPLLSV
ncbi:hypothetical protein BsWGS_15731 [Bradybaena similaris]